MAAILDVPGSAAALHTAASLWTMPGFSLEPVHVLAPRTPHRDCARLGKMHSTVRLRESDIVHLDGIPVTTPLRTLVDLAGRIRTDRLSQMCDRMIDQRLIRPERLHALVLELPERSNRPSVAELRRLALARPAGYRPAGSNLERRFEQIIERAGDPSFERQVDVGDDNGWIGRVDFIDRDRRVIVEVQSARFHGGLVDRERDMIRIERLRRAGWIVIEVTDDEVWHRADVVIARVRSARSRARRRPVAHHTSESGTW